MTWDRRHSKLEAMMLDILKKSKKPMTIAQIVEAIQLREPDIFTGKTPSNSLFSIIYRNEIKRESLAQKTLFKKIKQGSSTFYTPNK